MIIELLKEYKFGAKEKAVGTKLEVTNGLGEQLIKKKVAKEILKQDFDIDEALKNIDNKKVKKENKDVILQNNKLGEAPDTNNK